MKNSERHNEHYSCEILEKGVETEQPTLIGHLLLARHYAVPFANTTYLILSKVSLASRSKPMAPHPSCSWFFPTTVNQRVRNRISVSDKNISVQYSQVVGWFDVG